MLSFTIFSYHFELHILYERQIQFTLRNSGLINGFQGMDPFHKMNGTFGDC